MEAIWHEPGVQQGANICRWDEHGLSSPGTPRSIAVSAEVIAFRKRTYGGGDFPAWQKSPRISPPEWLKARYKADCPRNYKELIEAYGRTHTKYDADSYA
jgi:hypothetical protein